MRPNVRSMGLTHEAARAIHAATDELLDAFLARALETLEGGEALERELVDAARRWVARREGHPPGPRDHGWEKHGLLERAERWICESCGSAVDGLTMSGEPPDLLCDACVAEPGKPTAPVLASPSESLPGPGPCALCGRVLVIGDDWRNAGSNGRTVIVCEGCFNSFPGAGAG